MAAPFDAARPPAAPFFASPARPSSAIAAGVCDGRPALPSTRIVQRVWRVRPIAAHHPAASQHARPRPFARSNANAATAIGENRHPHKRRYSVHSGAPLRARSEAVGALVALIAVAA